MKNIWIALPAYTGTIHLGTMRSIVTDMLALAERGDRVTIFDECGNAMIAHARAAMVSQFLNGEGTHLIWVDADVAWEKGALLRLVDAPVDFVGAVYPQRKDPLNYCVQWCQDRDYLQADPETNLLEVAGIPAGFMRCSRNMLERMVAAYPETRFASQDSPTGYMHALFSNIHEGDLHFGEDYSFCMRWRRIGGQVWIDPEIRMGHCGYKTFTGSLGDWLRERMTSEAA